MNKIFLATTALDDFWDKDRKIIFISKSCLLYSKRDEWGKIDYEILPDYWSDRKRLNEAFKYCDRIYEHIIEILSNSLNLVHEVNHSIRYWRILLGPWLYLYNQMLYDKYINLNLVKKKYTKIDTYCLKKDDYLKIEDTTSFWKNLCRNDHFNLQLYSQLAPMLGINALPMPIQKGTRSIKRCIKQNSSIREKIKKYFYLITNLLARRSSILFGSSGRNLWHVAIKSGFIIMPFFTGNFIVNSDLNISKRKHFFDLLMQDSLNFYEKCLINTLIYNFPICFLEDYNSLSGSVKKYFKYRPRALCTSTGYWANEKLKVLAGIWSEKGTLILDSQHGGGYGTMSINTSEHIELNISDKYLSWGWNDNNNNNKIIPLPSLKLSKNNKYIKRKRSSKKYNLYVMYSLPRYFFVNMSTYIAQQFLLYIKNQKIFFNTLDSEALKTILIRPYHADYGWDHLKVLKDEFPALELDNMSKPQDFLYILKDSNIVISDQNQTTYLESLSANIPTIIFWDLNFNEIRKEAMPYFDLLAKEEIFFDNPYKAAKKFNEIYNSPYDWWYSKNVQEARKTFVNRFARIDDNYIEIWTDELMRIVDIK